MLHKFNLFLYTDDNRFVQHKQTNDREQRHIKLKKSTKNKCREWIAHQI